MKKYIVPRSFRLGGRAWQVKKVRRKGAWYGKCYGSRCLIRLNMSRIRNDEELLHTFVHELVHAICYTMGWERFNSDEIKVDAFASLLTQFIQTGRASKRSPALRSLDYHAASLRATGRRRVRSQLR